MPVRWTPENDQLLLLKILETHDLSVDTKKVAAAWPGADDNKPTPRAISERLVKMRQIVKAAGGGDGFSIGKGIKSNSATSTPRKPRTPASPSSTKIPGSGKRKRVDKSILGDNDDDNDDKHNNQNLYDPFVKAEGDDNVTESPSKKRPLQPTLSGNQFVKREMLDEEEFVPDVQDTPSKRSCSASVLPAGMVSYDDEDEQGGDQYESDATEYVPEESAVKREDLDIGGFE